MAGFYSAARMAPRVATGGHKSAFETDIGLYRKSFGANEQQVFDAKIESGGTLLLGEEILLRAAVREGDGSRGLLIVYGYIYSAVQRNCTAFESIIHLFAFSL